MLSILIPIYNIDCSKLVSGLHEQCTKAKINFEILCYDDKSRKNYRDKNKHLSHLFGISYVELNENLGRAKIRNKLAKYSNYEYLLFIDADSKLPNKSYIKNYLDELRNDRILYGGRQYTKRKPTAKKKIFHWTYGSQREAKKAKKRNKAPYLHFMSNNFIVPRQIFQKVTFDPDHEGYGYEDTLWATRVKELGYLIWHIDNPLIHSGIEAVDKFLEKSKNALDNLIDLYLSNKILDTKLIRFYKKLLKYNLEGRALKFINGRMNKIEKNLFSEHPKMRNFDLWKLHYFISHIKKS